MPYVSKTTTHIPPKKKLVYTLQNSQFFVTKSLTKRSLYGDTTCSMTGTVTASEDAQRKRVTGGILRISSMKDMFLGSAVHRLRSNFCTRRRRVWPGMITGQYVARLEAGNLCSRLSHQMTVGHLRHLAPWNCHYLSPCFSRIPFTTSHRTSSEGEGVHL